MSRDIKWTLSDQKCRKKENMDKEKEEELEDNISGVEVKDN